jgi:hypothetical protein
MRQLRIIQLVALAFTIAACLAGAALAAAAGGGEALSPSKYDVIFDDVPVGSTSAPQEVTVTNGEHGPVKVGQSSITGPHGQDFLLSTDTCSGKRLDDGDQCKLAFRFRPTARGTRVAHLKLPHDGNGCTLWITLAGSGPQQAAARMASCEEDDSSSTPPSSTSPSSTTTTASGDSSQAASTTVANSAIGLPAASSARACTSRRAFNIRINPPRGIRFTKVSVRLNKKIISVKRGKRLTASVSLKGLPRGRFTLRVVATSASGRTFSRTRHYVTCVQNKG